MKKSSSQKINLPTDKLTTILIGFFEKTDLSLEDKIQNNISDVEKHEKNLSICAILRFLKELNLLNQKNFDVIINHEKPEEFLHIKQILKTSINIQNDINDALRHPHPYDFVKALEILQNFVSQEPKSTQDIRHILIKHEKPSSVAQAFVDLKISDLLLYAHKESYLDDIIKHKYSSHAAKALIILKEADLLTGDDAKDNFNAVIKHERPDEAVCAIATLKNNGLLKIDNAKINFNTTLGHKNPADFAQALAFLKDKYLLTDADEEINRTALIEHDRPISVAQALVHLNSYSLLKGDNAQVNRELVVKHKNPMLVAMILEALQNTDLLIPYNKLTNLNVLVELPNIYVDNILSIIKKLKPSLVFSGNDAQANFDALIKNVINADWTMASEALDAFSTIKNSAFTCILAALKYKGKYNVAGVTILLNYLERKNLLIGDRAEMNCHTAMRHERPVELANTMDFMEEHDLLGTDNIEFIFNRMAKHKEPLKAAHGLMISKGFATLKPSGLFTDANANTNRNAVRTHKEPIKLIHLLILMQKLSLLTTDAQTNFNLIIAHKNFHGILSSVGLLQKKGVFQGDNAQMNFKMLASYNDPSKITSALLRIENQGFSTQEIFIKPTEILIDFLIKNTLLTEQHKAKVQKFIQHFVKNNNNDLIDKKDIICFFVKYQNKISQLSRIMGEDIFGFLQSVGINSTAPVQRFLDNYQYLRDTALLTCRELYLNFKLEIKKEHYRAQWINILYIWGILGLANNNNFIHSLNKAPINIEIPSQGITFDEYYTALSQQLVDVLVSSFNLPKDTVISAEKLLEKLPISMLPQLALARDKIKQSEYAGIFDLMLLADLDNETNLTQFITNANANYSNNNNKVKQLNQHNQAIIHQLTESNINVKLLHHYTKILSFNFGGDVIDNLNNQYQAIWNSFKLLREYTQQCQNSFESCEIAKKEVIELMNTIVKYQKQLLKANQGDDEEQAFLNNKSKLLNNDILVLADKLSNKIERIKSIRYQGNKLEFLVNVIEHGDHFTEYYKILKTMFENLGAKKESLHKKPRSFHVEAWDKNKMLTFFLGDLLSCCLASNGARFDAMIQRRMDEAMFMHVVIDEQTKLPVCGNWLFFAEDIDNPGEIYIVANFFEINSGLAANAALRDSLVNHLLFFTGEFSKEINAKGFIMRPLTYGQIPDFTQFGSLKLINIKKVGGSLGQSEVNLLLGTTDFFDKNIKDLFEAAILEIQSDETIVSHLTHLKNACNQLHDYSLSYWKNRATATQEQYPSLKTYNSIKIFTKDLTKLAANYNCTQQLLKTLTALIDTYETKNRATVQEHYYLHALGLSAFHLYNSEVMAHSVTAKLEHSDELIKSRACKTDTLTSPEKNHAVIQNSAGASVNLLDGLGFHHKKVAKRASTYKHNSSAERQMTPIARFNN